MLHILLAFILGLLAMPAHAAELHVVINEIQTNGQTADDEFIELYNPTELAVSLAGWSLQYKGAQSSSFSKKNFESNAVVPAHGFFLVAGKGYAGASDMVQSAVSLAQSGGNVFLVSDSTLLVSSNDPNIIDRVAYGTAHDGEGDAAIAPDTSKSISRIQGIDTDKNASDFAVGDPSPVGSGAPIVPEAQQDEMSADASPSAGPVATLRVIVAAQSIVINEFMADPPDGEKEWVEIYNISSSGIDLGGWNLADGTGKSFAVLEGLLLPLQFKLVELPSAKLNNGGDMIILRDPNKTIIDSVAYGAWESDSQAAPSAAQGYSTARNINGVSTGDNSKDFSMTQTPTPGSPNLISIPADVPAQADSGKETLKTKSAPAEKEIVSALEKIFKDHGLDLSKFASVPNVIIIEQITIQSGEIGAEIATVAPSSTKTKTVSTKSVASKSGTAKSSAAKSPNRISGTVIVKPDGIWKGSMVVQTESGGVEVRLPTQMNAVPQLGDSVTALGTWSQAKSLLLPKLLSHTAADISVAGHGNPPVPEKITGSELESRLGTMIELSGTVVERMTTKIRMAVDNVPVSVVHTDGIPITSGDMVTVKGLLVKNGSEYTVYPDGANAITVGGATVVERPANVAARVAPYAAAAAPAGLITAAVYVGKRFRKKGGDGDGRGKEKTIS